MNNSLTRTGAKTRKVRLTAVRTPLDGLCHIKDFSLDGASLTHLEDPAEEFRHHVSEPRHEGCEMKMKKLPRAALVVRE